MNTPKTPKRYAPVLPKNAMVGVIGFAIKQGKMLSGLRNPKYGAKLALIVTEFEHLEDHMAKLWAELSGMDAETAGYVLREIRAASVRRGVVETLLKFAKRNQHLGPEYDQAIEECGQAASLRNEYVHGRWWTSEKGNLVTFAPTDKYGLEYLNAVPITHSEMDYVLYRIQRAAALVTRLTLVPPNARAQLPAIPPLAPPPPQMATRHRIDSRETPPPQKSSRASPQKLKGRRKKERKAKLAARAKKSGG